MLLAPMQRRCDNSCCGRCSDAFDLPLLDLMKSNLKLTSTPSPKKGGAKREQEGWKEVVRRSKKLVVPSNAVARIIGRQGVNLNAIRNFSGANIDIEKTKGGDRTLTIKSVFLSKQPTSTMYQLFA